MTNLTRSSNLHMVVIENFELVVEAKCYKSVEKEKGKTFVQAS